MDENLQEKLEELEQAGKSGKQWDEWYMRVKNLVTSAKDVAKDREEWPVYNMLDVAEEMLCTGQGEKLGIFLESINNN